MKIILIISFISLLIFSCKSVKFEDEFKQRPKLTNSNRPAMLPLNPDESETTYWMSQAQNFLYGKMHKKQFYNKNIAKNIIVFLGDGMSLETTSATRVYMGGEEVQLSFEQFPHFGLSKTYCVDSQTADSACSATAILHGVKNNFGTIGLNGRAKRFDCTDSQNIDKMTESIIKWAQSQCKSTGFVTTSRVTHSTPAALYAHTTNKDWESDIDVVSNGCSTDSTIDIARQLIENDVALNLNVIMGGGRREFRDSSQFDEEQNIGRRTDGKNLIEEWLSSRNEKGKARYVWNKQSLEALDYENTDYLLGLFEADHMQYGLDIEEKQLENYKPKLSELTTSAIKFLQKSEAGYVLFVESARIDMAHHETKARKALDETAELSRTVELARKMTNESDTLIIVTSDHAHVMTYSGYAVRRTDILGINGFDYPADDGPYPTLSYANGPGFYNTYESGRRINVETLNFNDSNLEYIATVPLREATHSAQDVGVYASGPWSHLFIGTYEQNNIPLLLAYAAKIGPYAEESTLQCSGAEKSTYNFSKIFMFFYLFLKMLF